MPVSAGSRFNSRVKASKPPADAPTPTMGKSTAVDRADATGARGFFEFGRPCAGLVVTFIGARETGSCPGRGGPRRQDRVDEHFLAGVDHRSVCCVGFQVKVDPASTTGGERGRLSLVEGSKLPWCRY